MLRNICLLALVLAWAPRAEAKTMVFEDAAVVDVAIHPEGILTVEFPEQISQVMLLNDRYRAVRGDNDVAIYARPHAGPTHIRVRTSTATVTLRARLAHSFEEADVHLLFVRPTAIEQARRTCRALSGPVPPEHRPGWPIGPGRDAHIQAEIGRAVSRTRDDPPPAPAPSETSPPRPREDGLDDLDFVRTLGSGLLRIQPPVTDEWHDGSRRLSVRVALIASGVDRGLLQLQIDNRGEVAFPLAGIAVLDRQGHDHSLEVSFDGRPPGDVEPLQAGASTIATVMFNSAPALANGMNLQLTGRDDAQVIIDLDRRAHPHWNSGRTVLQAMAGGGGAQFAREQETGLTGAWEAGVQLYHGLEGTDGTLSIGGALSRLSTGEVDLAGVARSQSAYRLQFDLRLHVEGQRWSPYLRVGAGAALVSLQDGDESSRVVHFLGAAGAGIERWFGDSLVVGLEGGFESHTTDEGLAAFGLRAFAGFGWGGGIW
ncbi:hypothetical protein [Haliangium sp.]|uniref:hypothetical protein n=1 Tax=Haliangium sp. TaxID=2663208 RepID=UPI003D0F3686